MTKENTREKKVELVFAAHPKEDAIFMTSDDKCFFVQSMAAAHSQRLKDRTIEPFTRKAVEADKELANATGGDGSGKTGDGSDADEKEVLKGLRVIYKELYGKNPANQWNADKLNEMIAAKKAESAKVLAAEAARLAELDAEKAAEEAAKAGE